MRIWAVRKEDLWEEVEEEWLFTTEEAARKKREMLIARGYDPKELNIVPFPKLKEAS